MKLRFAHLEADARSGGETTRQKHFTETGEDSARLLFSGGKRPKFRGFCAREDVLRPEPQWRRPPRLSGLEAGLAVQFSQQFLIQFRIERFKQAALRQRQLAVANFEIREPKIVVGLGLSGL